MRFDEKAAIGRLDIILLAHPLTLLSKLLLSFKGGSVFDDRIRVHNLKGLVSKGQMAAIGKNPVGFFFGGRKVEESHSRMNIDQTPIMRRTPNI